MHNLDLSISDISKIEGKASCTIKVRKGKVEDLKFIIAEYKRFYTQAIQGKDIIALPSLTSRICGTCSNAHLLCAIAAIENALGIIPSGQTTQLRKLVNFGLNIRDHALHLYVFALPDILEIDNILELDENIPEQHQLLDDVFTVKAAGNMLSKTIGGRSVHAPFPTIGGFTKLPDAKVFPDLITQLEKARPAVLRLIHIFQDSKFRLENDFKYIALIDRDYSFLDGELLTSDDQTIKKGDLDKYLHQVIIPYSYASGYMFSGQLYMVGALARMNLAKERLHPKTKECAARALSNFPSINIFHNNLAQAIEILHAIDSSVDILKNLTITEEKLIPVVRKAGVGIGVIEAPRGILFYMLNIDINGKIENGKIVVPTGQNQIGIENCLKKYLETNISQLNTKKEIEQNIERVVRAFDPCMSCASHFLKIKWI